VTDALNGIVNRTQSEDFEWAVMAIDIQREVGGNLAELLQTGADTMRARNRLKGEIKALTAEGRI
jgi:tight adherence protein B